MTQTRKVLLARTSIRCSVVALMSVAPACSLPVEDIAQAERAQSNWCDIDAAHEANPADTYDHFPGDGLYPIGTVSEYPWYTGWGRVSQEDFEHYESGRDLSGTPWLSVTSGRLEARHFDPFRRGWAEGNGGTGARILASAYTTDNVQWTDQEVSYRAFVKNWDPAEPETAQKRNVQGLNVFARYRTENDLYVASYKRNGRIMIQRKLCGRYTKLVTEWQAEIPQNTWVTLTFRVRTLPSGANHLQLEVEYTVAGNSERHVVVAIDGDLDAAAYLSAGTHGIRTDLVKVYLDDWTLAEPPALVGKVKLGSWQMR